MPMRSPDEIQLAIEHLQNTQNDERSSQQFVSCCLLHLSQSFEGLLRWVLGEDNEEWQSAVQKGQAVRDGKRQIEGN